MSSNRHLARIIALQSLYEYEFRTRSGIEDLLTDMDQIIERNLAVYQESMSEDGFVRDLIEGTLKHFKQEDDLIAPAAPEWPIDQIAKMDLTILRLAVYELMIKREVPPKVVINEAVELAKAFGGDNSSKFINGVLGTIYRQSKFYDPTEDHKFQRERTAEDEPGSAPKKAASPQRSTEQEPVDQDDQSEPSADSAGSSSGPNDDPSSAQPETTD